MRNKTIPDHSSDHLAPTQPGSTSKDPPVENFAPNSPPPAWMVRPEPKRGCGCGCGTVTLILLIGLGLIAAYLLIPFRTDILLLGLDYTSPESSVARSDTIILTSFWPTRGRVAMLSIPRDLWVTLPDGTQNRINTAHFYAEAAQAGTGPSAAVATVSNNFGIRLSYYLRIRFDGFMEVVAALGGVDIELSQPTAGYPAGRHHLDPDQALAFVRSREGTDDFFRMQQGQLLLKAILKQSIQPDSWPLLPNATLAATRSIDTNVPIWLWPRLLLAGLRAGPERIESRQISRDAVTPTITDQGASILLPDWPAIQSVLDDHFAR